MSVPPFLATSPNPSALPVPSASNPSCSPGGGACSSCLGCSGSGALTSCFTSGRGGFCSGGGGGGGGGGGLSSAICTIWRLLGPFSESSDHAPAASMPTKPSKANPTPSRSPQVFNPLRLRACK